jgi:2'-5' RNA ligase
MRWDEMAIRQPGAQAEPDFACSFWAGRPAWRDVLYFAVLPDPETASRLHRLALTLCARHGLSARPRPAPLLHVSLIGVGEGADPGRIARLRHIGERVSRPDFDIVMGIALSFGKGVRKPLVLRCSSGSAAALAGLKDAIEDTAAGLGVGFRGRSGFEPHLTLAYDPVAIPETEFDEPIRWRARELVLMLSQQGRGRHIHLDRWPLRPCS